MVIVYMMLYSLYVDHRDLPVLTHSCPTLRSSDRNSAGGDCSANEVNIKIPLNREMQEGRLTFEDRNKLLAEMEEDVAEIVLEDNRLQTLAISIAERGEIGRASCRESVCQYV